MRTLLHIVNGGVMVSMVAGYSVIHDWQAWVLILWFVFAANAFEKLAIQDLNKKMFKAIKKGPLGHLYG